MILTGKLSIHHFYGTFCNVVITLNMLNARIHVSNFNDIEMTLSVQYVLYFELQYTIIYLSLKQ